EIDDRSRRRDDEEFVGSVPAQRHRFGELPVELVGHGQKGLVTGPVTVVVIEQPKVVDVDQRDPERRSGATRPLDLAREVAAAAAGARAMLRSPGAALAADPAGGMTAPASSAALEATIVPSSRRSSTRRISPGPVNAASSAWSTARSWLVGPVAGSRSRSWSESLRTARTVAESLATTVFNVPVEKWRVTITA